MFNRILVLAPHIDDGEFGCGGSISKWVEEGKEVHYIAFSSAEKSVPHGMPKDALKKEVQEATRILGIPPDNLILFDYPVREFPAYRQEILEDMIRLGDELKPELVLLPSIADTHQDHQTISQEGFRAFKKISMIGYEMPHNNLTFSTNLFVVLEERHVSQKVETLRCYKSQQGKIYATEDFIRSLARVRGAQIGVGYAEVSELAITFCNKIGADARELIRSTKAGVVLCCNDRSLAELAVRGKTLIQVRNPRLSFLRLIGAVFAEPRPRGIHPTAVIDPDAKIHPDVYIGPFTYVGKCEIGEGTVIYGHIHIYGGNVKIGKNVVIHAGTVIGVDGFGYARNEGGELEHFPHLGGVIIEDDVEIHSNVNIDRATLGNTIIGQGTKIDKFCHIGHNVVIGKHCVIIAHSMLGGSARIGDYVWIAPCACIRDGGIRIGAHALIGMGTVVTRDVPDGAAVMGVPARPIEDYKRILKAVKQLAGVEQASPEVDTERMVRE